MIFKIYIKKFVDAVPTTARLVAAQVCTGRGEVACTVLGFGKQQI
jgi:hypothetical protein